MEWNQEELESAIRYHLQRRAAPDMQNATAQQLFRALSEAIMDRIRPLWLETHKKIVKKGVKKAFYLSAEFLVGRALQNNLINLGVEKEVRQWLSEKGMDLTTLEEAEPEPGLGNGGLGRLAACFLDSLSTLDLPAMGYGIAYRYGIFRQAMEGGYQVEQPDNWLKAPYPFLCPRPERRRIVQFGGTWNPHSEGSGLSNCEEVEALPLDMPITGYGTEHVNTLRLWEARSPEGFDLQLFNQEKYQESVMANNHAEHISRVLYPSDRGKQGKILRLKQEYFFVSASIQDILYDFKVQYGKQFELLPEKAAIQLNDTHPVVAIPELMRLLVDVEKLPWGQAWDICSRTMAYTNHTILSEALEKWSVDLFRPLLPRIYNIIEEINHHFLDEVKQKHPNGPAMLSEMSIIESGQIRMAWLAIACCFSVNGVAWLHTEILKKNVLKDWYDLYPWKFNNKTNGVTQRRWLLNCNRPLSNWITEHIGEGWITKLSDLKKLLPLAEQNETLEQLAEIKLQNKMALAEYVEREHQITLDPQSLYDVQIKRLHEYKRQLLNVLHIIYLYQQLKKDPQQDMVKRSFIFGAKAAPGYHMAKQIIKLITSVADKVNNDPDSMDTLKVVFLENYCVSKAERLFPASDISEQISTAGKEASGTGNMKFMLNGALTLGTMDGANIEIAQEAGEENCFIFGLRTEEIHKIHQDGGYNPQKLVENDPALKDVMNSLQDGTFGDPSLFQDIHHSLLSGHHPDVYFVLKDFQSYRETQERVAELYRNPLEWQRRALMNIANSGKFSSDRTIEEYAAEIWKISKLG